MVFMAWALLFNVVSCNHTIQHYTRHEVKKAPMGDDRTAEAAKMRSVYIIGSERGPLKIGIANQVADRLSGLQTSTHEKLR
jgi:hypothetical protein